VSGTCDHNAHDRTLSKLRKDNNSLLKDKARMDWLADRGSRGNVTLPTECVRNNVHSLRDAIDAAMELE
jgi:hypothetical protein